MDIKPGDTVAIEITAPPKSEAARKTLIRVCEKDPDINRHHRRQKAKRPSWQEWRRGGRQWHHQMKSVSAVKLQAGEKYTVHASVDVLRDLNSVQRWVKVTGVG